MLKSLVKGALASGAGWATYGRLRTPALSVLTYHRINRDADSMFAGLHVETFREQMRWLHRRCRTLTPDEALRHAARPDRGPPTVLVTFDDGYRDYHDLAFPILEELGIPALVFIPTAFMDRNSLIWTDQVACAAHRSSLEAATLPWARERRFELRDPSMRRNLVDVAKAHLKGLTDAERRSALEELLEALQVPRPEDTVDRQMMTWAEIRATQPLTTYGGHSHGHAILSSMPRKEQVQDLSRCTELLHEQTGTQPTYFAYPNGRASDFNDFTQECLRNLGYRAAFTTIPGRNGPNADLMALRRQPTTGRDAADFAWLTAGLGA